MANKKEIYLGPNVFNTSSSFEEIQSDIYLPNYLTSMARIPMSRIKDSPLSLALPNGVKKYYCCGEELSEGHSLMVSRYCVDGFTPDCVPPYFNRSFYTIEVDEGWLVVSDIEWAESYDCYYAKQETIVIEADISLADALERANKLHRKRVLELLEKVKR